MTFHIATKHTSRSCRYCDNDIFIGAAYWTLNKSGSAVVCESCVNLVKWYLMINLIISER
jgi:hypothetical protein